MIAEQQKLFNYLPDEIYENEFLLFDRIEKIKSIINQYGEENFYLSFSGGKDGFDGKSYLLSPYVDRDIRNNLIHQSECRIANKNLSTKDKNHIRKYIISKINKNKRKRIKKHLALARQDR